MSRSVERILRIHALALGRSLISLSLALPGLCLCLLRSSESASFPLPSRS